MFTIEDDLRREIRESILKVCGKYKISETDIKYKLNLSVSYEIEDEIITKGEENVGNVN